MKSVTGYLCNSIGEGGQRLYVTSKSHLYANYSSSRKKLLEAAILKQEVQVLSSSVLVHHGNVEHAGSDRCREHRIWYRSYRILGKS